MPRAQSWTFTQLALALDPLYQDSPTAYSDGGDTRQDRANVSITGTERFPLYAALDVKTGYLG